MKKRIFDYEKIRVEFDTGSCSITELVVKNRSVSKNLLLSPIHAICEKEWESINNLSIVENSDYSIVESSCENSEEKMIAKYEIYKSGYITISFKIGSKNNKQLKEKIKLGISVDKRIFENSAIDVTNGPESSGIRENRTMSANYEKNGKVAGAIGFAVENIEGTRKIFQEKENQVFMGCECVPDEETCSYEYENRWFIAFSNIDNSPNKARGRRIYHWYGMYPRYPSDDLIEEMAEYGCSVLVLHMSVFHHIDGSVPADKNEMKRVVDAAKRLGMKVMFYCTPFLFSHRSPQYENLERCINNDGRKVWNSLKTSQIVFYEPNTDYDCDELCIRCPEAYEYIKNSVLNTYKKYGFDGIYIDSAWPGQGICSDTSHNHAPGIFNFYDYYRMIREWREEIGNEAIMIGHGGGLMVPADFVQSFDGCLTGEAQKELDPDILAVHSGCAPMLWTMHRRKQREFRSADTIYGIIKEGVTPHIGLGIMGKSIIASLDPAHTPMFLALWQMLRAFPVEKARFYNYREDNVVVLDNDEVAFSLYVTEKKQALLLLANGGGPTASREYSVGVNAKIDIRKHGLPDMMKCRRLKGDRYENFRILPEETICDGLIEVPEIGINELVGFVLSSDGKVGELDILEKHLENRFERLSKINGEKMKRLLWSDAAISDFNRRGAYNPDEDEFMKNREME